ncbi:hypothetical protein EJ08DRAFT_658475 [Tothia fuscella]|uniref:Uncharacterized protein n=1 Tax=Tothia fuscella TaxID=1048955 RepID=A0A9P4U0Y5_9PEZI|nr:hypothetical protein EJ08DRAFT_658475 [Tothia fuscella]
MASPKKSTKAKLKPAAFRLSRTYATKKSSLLKLSQELRDMVYGFYLEEHVLHCGVRGCQTFDISASRPLLFVNKQIFYEYKQFFDRKLRQIISVEGGVKFDARNVNQIPEYALSIFKACPRLRITAAYTCVFRPLTKLDDLVVLDSTLCRPSGPYCLNGQLKPKEVKHIHTIGRNQTFEAAICTLSRIRVSKWASTNISRVMDIRDSDRGPTGQCFGSLERKLEHLMEHDASLGARVKMQTRLTDYAKEVSSWVGLLLPM